MHKFFAYFISIVLCISLVPQNASAAGYQFDFNAGMDMPDSSSSARSTNAYLLQFGVSNYAKFVRLNSTFSFVTGSQYMQGEFGLGTRMYFVTSSVRKEAPFHPFIMAHGVIGFGSLKEESRQDMGFDYGAGVDIMLGKKGGIAISVSQQNMEEKSLRIFLGFFSYKIR